MRVTHYDRATGQIEVVYSPACNASNHTIYYGALAHVASYDYTGAACGRGKSGKTWFTPGTLASAFFVITGNTGAVEGSYGKASSGAERPEDTATPGCDLPQNLAAGCN